MFYRPYGFGYGYGYSSQEMWTYILVLLALAFSMFCSFWVNSTFRKYNQVPATHTGAQAARHVLDANGLYNVRVEHVAGSLSDHFDPRTNVVRLSDSTYSSASAGAIGVACHEVGHAIQYARGYWPAKLRTALVPVVNIGSQLAIPLLLAGFIFNIFGLVRIGIICFGLSLVFGLVTLPVEINASRRAIRTMQSDHYFTASDVDGARHVLLAAASTYLASVFVSLAQLLRMIAMSNRNSRR